MSVMNLVTVFPSASLLFVMVDTRHTWNPASTVCFRSRLAKDHRSTYRDRGTFLHKQATSITVQTHDLYRMIWQIIRTKSMQYKTAKIIAAGTDGAYE